ncbi:MAG: hypothetical protein KAV87_17955 [Desulfobacteraceae bacterium]|nr:hypothetical protein [Desulfobacteraceae bacterium]
MENMRFWNQCNQPPLTALKQIQAGRLKGKSDINPQWRYQVLTEIFGPCGIGWKFTIDQLWTEAGSFEQIFAFARISLFVKIEEKWSEPIPGIGGSMLVAKEKAGLYSSDEAYKMSVTDALSTACKMLGVAADIYAGFFDGAKYANIQKPANRLIKLINSDKTVEDLKKRHKDNLPLIKSFPDNLKKKIMDAINARHKTITTQETTPLTNQLDPAGATLAPQNEEEIPPLGEDNLPPEFDEEPTPRLKAIRDTKAFLDGATKEQLPSFVDSLKTQLDKMPPEDQSEIRAYYERLINR